jgi:hypothetical protein
LIDFEGQNLQEQIKGLIGEVVKATIIVRQPRVGTAIDLQRVDLKLVEIAPGEGDVSAYGMTLFDLDEH